MIEVAAFVVQLWTVAGLMAIGFGVMLGGGAGASRAARLFFMRPLSWSVQQLRMLAITIIVGTWQVLVRYVLRPVWDELLYWLRRIARWIGG